MRVNPRNIFFGLLWTPFVVSGVFQLKNALMQPAAGHWGLVEIMSLLSVVGYTVFFALIFFFTLTRLSRIAAAEGFWPRFIAVAGGFLPMTVASFPSHALPTSLLAVSLALIVTGEALAIYGIVNLGASFSIMSEARAVVTKGIYRFVRHPIYLFEDIALIGIFLQHTSLYSSIILFVCLAFQIKRIHNEEAVLQKSFPTEYAAYKKEVTARLIPGAY